MKPRSLEKLLESIDNKAYQIASKMKNSGASAEELRCDLWDPAEAFIISLNSPEALGAYIAARGRELVLEPSDVFAPCENVYDIFICLATELFIDGVIEFVKLYHANPTQLEAETNFEWQSGLHATNAIN